MVIADVAKGDHFALARDLFDFGGGHLIIVDPVIFRARLCAGQNSEIGINIEITEKDSDFGIIMIHPLHFPNIDVIVITHILF